ncbi:LytR/AlgR family response regulator transcription factor [Carnobacterium divergens]|nr:LytTR family DNA-binding domain-containing protein [Carnobacterium divergens]
MEYAIEGYQVNALRYLLKPIQQGQLNDLLELIAGKRKEEVLTISTKFGQKKILLKDITYIESKQRKLYFYSNQEVDRMYGKMGEFAASLAKKNFFRPHQSYLVQLEFVKELKKDHLILVDGSVIPVSKGNAKSFKAAFFDYLSQDGDSYG